MRRSAARYAVITSFLWLFTGTGMVPAQSPDTRTVTVIGIGAIMAEDHAKARDDAIRDALRNAVEQAVGTMIASETLVENAMVMQDRIYSKTTGYIQRYTPVDEKTRPDAVEVTIEAVVKLGDLERDLEGIILLLQRLKRPRIMVLMEEQNLIENPAGDAFFSTTVNTAEATLIDAFGAKGFDFVDQTVAKQSIERDKALAAAAGDVAAAAALGQQFAAEVVIIGKAVASQAVLGSGVAGMLGDMKSCQASVTARAIRVDTGGIIAQGGPAQGVAAHINPMTAGTQAIQKASTALSDGLMRKVLLKWQQETSGSTMVRVLVHNVGFMQLRDFEQKLRSHIRGVSAVHRRQFTNNEAILDVEMAGNADALAEELSVKDLETLRVEITGVSQNRVEVRITTK